MKTASFHWDHVDGKLLDIIPWLTGHENDIRPASALVTKEIVAEGVRTMEDLERFTTEKGPAIIAAANDLKAAGHTPRQVVLRALLAAGIPANPERRALIERLATHVDAIVADFDAWFLTWENLAADPNAWQTGEIDRFLYLKDHGGFGALSSQEWGLEWWPWMLIFEGEDILFSSVFTLGHKFAVKWRRVLGLAIPSLGHDYERINYNHVEELFIKFIPSFPKLRCFFRPDLTSRESWESSRDTYSRFSRLLMDVLVTMLEDLDPHKISAGDGMIEEDVLNKLSKKCVESVLHQVSPHVGCMIDDLKQKMDETRTSDDAIISWIRETGASRDFNAAMYDMEDRFLEMPAPVPRDIIPWMRDCFLQQVMGTARIHSIHFTDAMWNRFKEKTYEHPLYQETVLFLLTWTFSSESYQYLWEIVRSDRISDRRWIVLLAWVIEWRKRLGFDIVFLSWLDDGKMRTFDPQKERFGIYS